MAYNVYRAVPTVTVIGDNDRTIECPLYPKGYVLVGTFRKEDDGIQEQQVEREGKPACYHYEPVMPSESA